MRNVRAPIQKNSKTAVLLPATGCEILTQLLREFRSSIANELGGDFQFVTLDPQVGPRWYLGPYAENPPIGRVYLENSFQIIG
jgi:hypothetical protein